MTHVDLVFFFNDVEVCRRTVPYTQPMYAKIDSFTLGFTMTVNVPFVRVSARDQFYCTTYKDPFTLNFCVCICYAEEVAT